MVDWSEIPGATALCEWYGGFPGFHDANAELQIRGDGTGLLKAWGFRTTDKVDEKGFLILDQYFAATLFFDDLKTVTLSEFQPGLAILGGIEVSKKNGLFVVDFDSAYGMAGLIVCKTLRVEFEPGAKAWQLGRKRGWPLAFRPDLLSRDEGESDDRACPPLVRTPCPSIRRHTRG